MADGPHFLCGLLSTLCGLSWVGEALAQGPSVAVEPTKGAHSSCT